MARLNNPIGPKVSIGNGYYYQRITLPTRKGTSGSYVKVWHHDKVIDRAVSVPKARAMAQRYATRELI